MTLREQFEKVNYGRPVEPFSESKDSEQWCRVLEWTEDYVDWLETRVYRTNNYNREDIFNEIRGCCISDDAAMHAANKVLSLFNAKFV